MLPVWIVLVLLPIFGEAERFNCRGRILGAYYADAKSGCKAFHVCVRVAGGGIKDFRFFCPPGTLFHQEAQTCTDWGDDDPLACPADIYDGQFDLYKIGSGFDTKKLSSPANRDEESEFGLQRAETGDRRLSQNNGASDLRAAHSSDFFSGQRDRGRDDSAPASPQNTPLQYQNPASSRQSFRRPTPSRVPPTATQYTTTPPPPPSAPSNPPSYETSKRKLVRKRPYYTSTSAPPTTFAQTTQHQQSFPEQQQQQQPNFNRRAPQNRQTSPPFNVQPQNRQTIPPENVNTPQQNRQTIPPANIPQQNRQTQPPANIPQQNRQTFPPSNVPSQTKQTIPPVNVPPQYKDYKDEYVEVPRVTPKPNKYFQSKSPVPFSQSSPAPNYNKKSLVELYNYDSQSTPGLNTPNDRPFKVRNSFNVAGGPEDQDYLRTKNLNSHRPAPTTVDYNQPPKVTTISPAFKNFNSVSYEPEKNNFISYSKQNYFNTNPTTPPSTTIYTTTNRPDVFLNLNTVAYNTNIGFNTQQSNYAESDEDDGQYRPPQGEDDGQYRPELYERERELLSGAHSLNIAASGNRLPDDQKPRGKTQPPFKPVSQTAAPRPFRPAPSSPPQTQRVSEQTYPTTIRPQTQPQPQSQRTFDYFQTYTTTVRPTEQPASPATFKLDGENISIRPTTTFVPRNPEPRQQTRAPTQPPQPRAPTQSPPPPQPRTQTQPPQPPQAPVSLRPTSSSRPFFANPANNKEDTSYDYAYYDSDPGFSEYDHIEEFGKTKKKA